MNGGANPEPAIRSYFFGKGYSDLRNTIKTSWELNLGSARDHFDKVARLMPGEVGDKALAVLWGAAGLSVVVFGTALFLVASMVHITVLLAFFLLIYLGFSLVYLTERSYLTVRRFFTVCPDCHSKSPLPEYFCPQCGAIHRRLVPSSYGILHRTCRCGGTLPATFFLQRGRLPSRCPDCKSALSTGHTESRKAFVPIFGGPSVGKSAFLFSAIGELVNQASQRGLQLSFLDERTEAELARARAQLAQGRAPGKTLSTLPRAFNLKVQAAGHDPLVLYLYDPAGEAFLEAEGLALHRYQAYLSGLIFLIDPFTIPAVRVDYGDRLESVHDALRPSQVLIEDALSQIFINLEEHFGLRRGSRLKVPVAVVISKVDAFDLEQTIGGPAVAQRLKSSPIELDPDATRDELIRDQLRRWKQGDVVQQIEARCTRVRYFTCSALGRMPDGSAQPFTARGVLEPVLWVLSKANAVFGTEHTIAAA